MCCDKVVSLSGSRYYDARGMTGVLIIECIIEKETDFAEERRINFRNVPLCSCSFET